MPGLRSLRNRLAVIFALIILGAIGTIYLSVTPRLEDSLTSQRLDQVRAASAQYTPDVAWRTVAMPDGGVAMLHQRALDSTVVIRETGGDS